MDYCSDTCMFRRYPKNDADRVIRVGNSKRLNEGYIFGDSLLIERMAENWTGLHLYKTPVSRDALRKNDNLILSLKALKHPNVMEISGFCSCSVMAEYIDGWLLNSHKESYILLDQAYQEDFLDHCDNMELVKSIDKVVLGLFELHKHGILHTDLTDFNVMVRKSTRQPVIIDLLGCIPAGSQKFDIHKDYWVFVHHFLIPTLSRRGLHKQEEVVQHFSDYNRAELERYINFLHENL